MVNSDKLYIPAFWFSSNNFGDNLTHYLIHKISGKTPVLCYENDSCLKYMVTGSIMAHPVTNSAVWGCGIAFRNSKIPNKSYIYAVRGMCTGQRLKELNMPFNEVYGDPALLLPKFYSPKSIKKYDIGIIPHYVDIGYLYDRLGMTDEKLSDYGIKIIDPMSNIEPFIYNVLNCKKIISSSLHGLITAVAYNIPTIQIVLSNNIGGDGIKYADFNSTLEKPIDVFFVPKKIVGDKMVNYMIDISKNNNKSHNLKISLDALWQACPFKKDPK